MSQRLVRLITSRFGALAILLVAAGLSALVFLTSPSQPVSERTDGLPAQAQSTRVVELAEEFPSARTETLIVVFERAGAPLTSADRAAVETARQALAPRALGAQVPPAVPAEDGQAALLIVPVAGELDETAEAALVDDARRDLRDSAASRPAGLTAQVTGSPAFSRDISAAFEGADVRLLLTTAAVVAVLLLLTYRSPLLWVVPLVVIGVGDQTVAKLLPWVARLIGERTDAAVSGIVSVLVFGAGTNYALLLISRYREELRRTPSRRLAMQAALREAAPAVIASAGTVVLALLTLLAAVVTGNRTLGISAALGVVVALIFGLVVLPAALVSVPRGIFWPFVPREGSREPTESGLWARIASLVSRRPLAVLTVAVVLLGGLSFGLLGTRVGLSQTEQFRTKPESVTAQQALSRHFPAGSSQPATVVSTTAAAEEAVTAVQQVPGVAGVGQPERSDDGRLSQMSVQLVAESGTKAADETVQQLRAAVAAVPGADALVGGLPASDLDAREANLRDNALIAPLVLGVVLVVLVVLLRSVVAPILLVITVVASFAASLGAASVVLRFLLDIPALDASVPLLAFLFLVALGVDYNIFLVTRAREEAAVRGSTRAGVLRALAATGGVITSAGVLLAAVFTVLGVLPVIALTQIGVIVGIGVLLDTLLVRTLVVPALALLLGERFWWPAHPVRSAAPAAEIAPADGIGVGVG